MRRATRNFFIFVHATIPSESDLLRRYTRGPYRKCQEPINGRTEIALGRRSPDIVMVEETYRKRHYDLAQG